jgi:hypothetical protein
MIAVINLPERPGRLAAFRDSYAASGWADVLGEPLVGRAWDGNRVRPWAWKKYPPGVWGCYSSHLMLIERALASHDEALYVFEDDAIFKPDSAGELRQFLLDVPSHNALWFGGQHYEHDTPAVGWRRVDFVMRTHAYALSRRMMQAIIPELRRMVGHLDGLYPALIHEFYVPEPMLVGQAAGVSDISGYPEPERWWNP